MSHFDHAITVESPHKNELVSDQRIINLIAATRDEYVISGVRNVTFSCDACPLLRPLL